MCVHISWSLLCLELQEAHTSSEADTIMRELYCTYIYVLVGLEGTRPSLMFHALYVLVLSHSMCS